MFLWLNNLQLSKNRQPHPVNQVAYKFYLGVQELFCVQRTTEEQPLFLCWIAVALVKGPHLFLLAYDGGCR